MAHAIGGELETVETIAEAGGEIVAEMEMEKEKKEKESHIVELEKHHHNAAALTTPTQSSPPQPQPPPTGDETSHLVEVNENELVLEAAETAVTVPPPTKSDKAVCTNDTLEDLQRALTYEAVFNTLLENKVLAMKRDCEERKRAKRMKRKSIGRIFFAKKLFGSSGSRKSSICGRYDSEQSGQVTPPPAAPRIRASESHVMSAAMRRTIKPKKTRSVDEIEIATTSTPATQQLVLERMQRSKSKTDTATSPRKQAADESVASTLSNSSEKYSNGGTTTAKRSLLVRAQTHTHTGIDLAPGGGGTVSTSSSGDSKDATTTPQRRNGAALSVSLPYDTASLPSASAYENAQGSGLGGDRLHTSTMADDSLTSIRDDDDSIESLSFASSRYTVSFGGTEIIPEDTASLLYERELERARAAKRLRILEAKSISAQCSPIFPRHITKALPALASDIPVRAHTKTIATTTLPTTTITSPPPPPADDTARTRMRFLPNQVSYEFDAPTAATGATYTRYFSRQNTSEDSANLTVSTLLNQSDSLSLHLPPGYASPTTHTALPFGGCGKTFERYKSKSTSLLLVANNGRNRPPPSAMALPTAQLAQLHITSNIKRNLETHLVDSVTNTEINTPLPVPLPLPQRSSTSTSMQSQSQSHKSHSFRSSVVTTSIQPPITTVSSSLQQYYHPVITSGGSGSDNVVAAATSASTATTLASSYRNGVTANGAIVSTSLVHDETAKLNRMTSTSTGSSVAPTGCCTTTKSSSRDKEKERQQLQQQQQQQYQQHSKLSLQTGHSGSDDEYRRRKRKYKRYHRCSDPVLVYPTPSGLQHCILSIPPNDPVQFPYGGDFAYDMQLQMESEKIVVGVEDDDDLEEMVPGGSRRHRRHRHHRHKKRHRHKKPKILVQDLETQVVKVIDPDDLPQRARWTIIATACLLLLMCLMLVGITLRMAPIIDDMVRQENERLMKETMDRARYGKNFTDTASLIGGGVGGAVGSGIDGGIGSGSSLIGSGSATTAHLRTNTAHTQQIP